MRVIMDICMEQQSKHSQMLVIWLELNLKMLIVIQKKPIQSQALMINDQCIAHTYACYTFLPINLIFALNAYVNLCFIALYVLFCCVWLKQLFNYVFLVVVYIFCKWKCMLTFHVSQNYVLYFKKQTFESKQMNQNKRKFGIRIKNHFHVKSLK